VSCAAGQAPARVSYWAAAAWDSPATTPIVRGEKVRGRFHEATVRAWREHRLPVRDPLPGPTK
jgi:hypothetical protein